MDWALRFAEAWKALMQSAVVIAQTLQQRQNALGLEQVLSIERLTSPDGIAASLRTIDTTEQLAADTRDVWQRWMLEVSGKISGALADFPDDRRTAESQGVMQTLAAQMAIQQRSQAARAEWIDAARAICHMAQRGRAIAPDAPLDEVPLADDDLDDWPRQWARIEAASQEEHRILEERAARIRAGMARMQPG